MRVVYIAGKFRGQNAWEVAENIRAAERVGFEVAKLGACPLIPHANTAHFDGTLTDMFWIGATLELLRRCDAILLRRCDAILLLPDWYNSVGATGERREALRLGMPVFYEVDEVARWLGVER